ncbi:hypothetical protein BU16DRAFT_544969 [Lophium mytilinum]|uniref:Myb-like domain-containing protein n=1 Tax=Lophium mytilinum TaxID=390894 RepID=A0A6A6QB11_9PEZI|nr:hypothetical protein BU16DRAFT_544969 [Lophium mytilinum]
MTPRMEPRIASLLGDPASSFLLDPPLLSQSNHGDQSQSRQNDTLPRIQLPSPPKRRAGRTIPLTEVLNFDGDGSRGPNGDSSTGVIGGFSGRLGDILLDGGVGNVGPRKKRRVESPPASTSSTTILSGTDNATGGGARLGEYSGGHVAAHENGSTHIAGSGGMASVLNNDLMLPKPHPPPAKKKGRRPRIPPLLQGLHHPPPDAGLFPPITGGRAVAGSRVGEGAEERVILDVPVVGERALHDDSREETRALVVEPSGEKENADEEKGQGNTNVKKRNKWTEQETKDLLQGVSKFGIGNWKKILDCDEYSFSGRTSVDLKDRFRTCCPDEYVNYRAAGKVGGKKSKSSTMSNRPSLENLTLSKSSPLGSPNLRPARKPRSGTHRKGAQELAEMGIEKPFEKSKRRERHEFTDEDDAALMKGFDKHGPVWNAIKSDTELGFESRKPADLRDRFRIRFPDEYTKAGFKLKPKEEKKHKDAGTNVQVGAKVKVATNSVTIKSSNNSDPSLHSAQPSLQNNTAAASIPKLLAPLQTAFPISFDDFASEAEDDTAYSPITLSRNILQFQWGDTNPSYMNPSNGGASTNAPASITSHLNFHNLGGMDQFHIDPLATLKLPPASSSTTSYSAFPPAAPPTNPVNASLAHSSYGSGVKGQQGQNFSTNLPTLVFPSAPQYSGRASGNGVNLPPPADLLNGLDLDGRMSTGWGMDTQPSQFLWDDGLGASGYVATGSGGLTAASGIGNGGQGSGVNAPGTVQVRGMFESDGLGERSLLNSSI